ncbi:MAG: hypothetical protein AMS16_01530 [Planctomycetes bacterium DG_58]|nr:MAG: hypothetical protein AMS16_01530 [Planctomycetes bacterium DG_58]KPL03206.1 MAG: hypothetical protein AMK75_01790 [Planctomycetes bacterium SM23_65]
MKRQVLSNVRKAIRTSSVIAASKAIKKAGKRSVLFGAKAKPISHAIVAALEANGCWCDDWSRVKAVARFDPVRVWRAGFIGDVVLGKFQGKAALESGVAFANGIYDSIVANCEIDDALVYAVKLLSNYIVKSGAVIAGCGTVAVTDETDFANGTELAIAIETGGRDTRIFGEMSCVDAEWVGKSRDDKEFLADFNKLVDSYVAAVTSPKGTIESNAVLRNTPRVENAYVGEHARVDGATLVKNATILSAEGEETEIITGAYVRNSILQWGCEVASMAIVDKSLLTEHSHVERHGKCTESILGPNTGVAEGEVTASLCGPFVGFHHQALLIAAFWPEGKGNVGYGANVGSNHTSKAPDQELWPGEGTFFGLGVNIKFPSDFTKAPYAIIASGVATLPQKVTFPFSLINAPAQSYPGISPAYNEIMPGWVLSDNIFTIRRNEGKYKDRNKARRTEFIFDVFRPDTVDLMLDGRKRLSDVAEPQELYTDRDISGLGKNYMLEHSRVKAIETYTFYIRYYALLGLKSRIETSSKSALKALLTTKTRNRRWEHERRILVSEFGKDVSLAELLEKLSEAVEKIAVDTQISKEKDDTRGARIIDDYPHAHAPAVEDKFVKKTWAETRELKAEITELIKKVGKS